MDYQRLLVPHDGSVLADEVLSHVTAISKATGADVLLLRVSRAAGREPEQLRAHEWRDLIDQPPAEPPHEAEPLLSRTVEKLRSAGVQRAGSLVVRGTAGEAIVETAARLDCDLIAISSHGLSGLRRAVLGSVSNYVIRHSNVPVLLCHVEAPAATEYRKILVALDGSEPANAAIPHAEYLAQRTGAEVVLVRVVDSLSQVMVHMTPAGYEFGGDGEITVEIAESVVASQQAGAESDLEATAARLRNGGVADVATRVIQGIPGDAIVDATEQDQADLVIIGTHGRGGLGRALLGSVADHVALHTPHAPVLMVRALDDAG